MKLSTEVMQWVFGQTAIRITSPLDLQKFLTNFRKELNTYQTPSELKKLLQIKLEYGAPYPFYMLISGRLKRKIEMIHVSGSKYVEAS
jgi:hypothetical protein